MQKRLGKMHLFKSREPNLVHYATVVTHNRVPVFRNVTPVRFLSMRWPRRGQTNHSS